MNSTEQWYEVRRNVGGTVFVLTVQSHVARVPLNSPNGNYWIPFCKKYFLDALFSVYWQILQSSILAWPFHQRKKKEFLKRFKQAKCTNRDRAFKTFETTYSNPRICTTNAWLNASGTRNWGVNSVRTFTWWIIQINHPLRERARLSFRGNPIR